MYGRHRYSSLYYVVLKRLFRFIVRCVYRAVWLVPSRPPSPRVITFHRKFSAFMTTVRVILIAVLYDPGILKLSTASKISRLSSLVASFFFSLSFVSFCLFWLLQTCICKAHCVTSYLRNIYVRTPRLLICRQSKFEATEVGNKKI